MHIRPTKLLKISLSNVRYNLEGNFYKKCTSLDSNNEDKIKEVITANNNKDNNKKDFQEKNK